MTNTKKNGARAFAILALVGMGAIHVSCLLTITTPLSTGGRGCFGGCYTINTGTRVSITLVDGATNASVSPSVFNMMFFAIDELMTDSRDYPLFLDGGPGDSWSDLTISWGDGITLTVLLNDTAGRYLPAFHDLVEGENVLTIYPVGWTP